MNRGRDMKDRINETLLPDPAFILGNAEYLGGADAVLHADPVGRYEPVVALLHLVQGASSRFFERHDRLPVPAVARIPGILHHKGMVREEIAVGYPPVMHPAADRRADEEDGSEESGDDAVLDGMPLLLAAVFIALFVSVRRAGNLPLRTVVQQDGELLGIHALVKGPEVPLRGCRADGRLRDGLPEQTVKQVYPSVAVRHGHVEMVGHRLLKGIVLEVIEYEVEAVSHTGQRTVAVYAWRSYPLPRRSVELVVSEILVMLVMEIWKQGIEMIDAEPCQGSESGRIGAVSLITHDNITRKHFVYACTRII